ncbi:MAG: hypothetical protein WAV32_01090, partial [Halobacteriota archaeon]
PSVTASTIPAAQTITSYGQDFVVNYDNITLWLDGEDSTILVGQVIQFYNATGGPSGKVTLTGVSGEAKDEGDVKSTGSDGRLETTLKTGKYETRCDDPSYGCTVTNISVSSVDLELKLKSGTKTVSSIPRGTCINIKFTGLDPAEHDGVTLKVTDPGGDAVKVNPADGTVFDKVNVAHITDREIDTAGWELGTYKFKVSTEEEYARGLDKESAEEELEIVSPELKIVAKKTEIVELEKVKLTVTGVPDHNISILVDRGAEHATFPASVNDNLASTKIGNFTDLIDADGKMEYVAYFDKIGSYTVKVKDVDSVTEDFVDISVSKKKVTLTIPETCAIGAELVVNGTSNTGKTVDIAIENRIVKVDSAIDTKGKFEVKLPTSATYGTGTEGGIKIKAFIDRDFSFGQDASGVEDDGSTMVLMVTGDLTAESSATLVPPGDSFTLRGTAPGSKVVDILIVGPKGGGGRGMNPANSEANGLPRGVVYEAASVSSDFAWSIDIDADEDADTGTYLVFVLSPGKDKIYDGIRDADLLNGTKTKYFDGDLSRLAGKTQELINATLYDATIGTAGSDDFMKKLSIKVGTAEVSLYSIADVEIGGDLVITGTSNREGHSIIVKVTGPVDLGTKFAPVENGKFKANFSTSEALTGEYTVEADDGEGHTDTTVVNIIMPVRTVASPPPTPTATPVPTTSQEMPAPASTPTTQPENSSNSTSSAAAPGFEAVFVITALVVVYLFISVPGKKRK